MHLHTSRHNYMQDCEYRIRKFHFRMSGVAQLCTTFGLSITAPERRTAENSRRLIFATLGVCSEFLFGSELGVGRAIFRKKKKPKQKMKKIFVFGSYKKVENLLFLLSPALDFFFHPPMTHQSCAGFSRHFPHNSGDCVQFRAIFHPLLRESWTALRPSDDSIWINRMT